MENKVFIVKTGLELDSILPRSYNWVEMSKIQESMAQELAQIAEMQSELDELTFSYERYRFLVQELQVRVARLEKIKLLLRPQAQAKKLPIWEIIELFLHLTSEAKVRDIQEFLTMVGRPGVSRQSISSALKIHEDIFQRRKAGKEQFVSLKSPSGSLRPIRFDPVIQEATEAIIEKIGPNVLQEVAEGLGWEFVKKEVIAIQRKEKVD